METTTGQPASIHFLGITLSPWVYAPVIFVLWLIVTYSLKQFMFLRLKRWGEKLKIRWGDFFINILNFPLNVIIFSTGIALLGRLLPLPDSLDEPITIGVKILTIFALFFFFDRLISESMTNLGMKIGSIDLSRGLVQGLIRLTVLSFGLLIVLDSLGISITPLIASLGIGSLALALGLQETLANLFAGIYILADQPIRAGDFIKLESGEQGYVTEIGWRNTRIRMLSDVMVSVPNNKIISSTIHNYYLPGKEMAVTVELGVHYSSDLEKVERVTIETAKEVLKKFPGAVSSFQPVIRFHTFADSSINFTAVLRVKEVTEQYLLKHEFIKALHAAYQKEGIVIPYPIRMLEIPQETLKALQLREDEKTTRR